ncbi:hypothetical protein B0H19DRAFT_1078016 [Mycena capillaripes]|nr:hypothetical protein B0H19DRAFT_1078016 [Mycena capillaripes]
MRKKEGGALCFGLVADRTMDAPRLLTLYPGEKKDVRDFPPIYCSFRVPNCAPMSRDDFSALEVIFVFVTFPVHSGHLARRITASLQSTYHLRCVRRFRFFNRVCTKFVALLLRLNSSRFLLKLAASDLPVETLHFVYLNLLLPLYRKLPVGS